MRSATSASRSARRANATTSQPRARRNRTHASPMPDDAPVTTARRGGVAGAGAGGFDVSVTTHTLSRSRV
ncbi:Uncharacterised protein [Mycobacteroides abscessus]|nr:Uncharacterised protein [Mycobacteroides abscessus]